MIPRPFIAKWQQHAPWKEFAQVEQDLVISRTLVEIFTDEEIRMRLKLEINCKEHFNVLDWVGFSF